MNQHQHGEERRPEREVEQALVAAQHRRQGERAHGAMLEADGGLIGAYGP